MPRTAGLTNASRRSWQRRLRLWYLEHARDLPWRHTRNAFHIWVSEVMLQQTQVSTVVPYYERFVRRFHTLESFADAPLDEVLHFWQGLGYYRRAVNLHRAAREVLERFHGTVPRDERDLQSLPGVGRYIAGAIRSFAFDLPAAVLEANSVRVLCRLFAIRAAPATRAVQQQLWQLSEQLVPADQPAVHNQAIMELGALVCVPGRPHCGRCPLERSCAARRLGVELDLPRAVPRRQFVDVADAAAWIWRRGRVLLVQRPVAGRWGGLWELPRTTVAAGDKPRRALRSFLRTAIGLDVSLSDPVARIKHGVTHHRITLACYKATCVRGRVRAPGYVAHRWVALNALERLPLSSPQRRLIEAVRGNHMGLT